MVFYFVGAISKFIHTFIIGADIIHDAVVFTDGSSHCCFILPCCGKYVLYIGSCLP